MSQKERQMTKLQLSKNDNLMNRGRMNTTMLNPNEVSRYIQVPEAMKNMQN